jgi:hypothetical protein
VVGKIVGNRVVVRDWQRASVSLISRDRTATILTAYKDSRDRIPGVTLLAQLLEERLRILEIRGVEALSEPAVDFGEHHSRFVAMALRYEQPR